jgi:hypothetical protein
MEQETPIEPIGWPDAVMWLSVAATLIALMFFASQVGP